MMKKLFYILFFICSTSLAKSPTSTLSISEINKLQSSIKKIDYLSVMFIHKIFNPIRNRTRIITGKAYFEKSGKFRWVKKTPIKEEIIYNGKTLFIYKPDEKVAQKFSSIAVQAKEINKLGNIILNINKLIDTYDITKATYTKNKTILILDLTPKKKTDLKTIHLKISLQRNYVKKVELTYKDGKKWTFEFKNPRTSKIPDEIFNFICPKDVIINKL